MRTISRSTAALVACLAFVAACSSGDEVADLGGPSVTTAAASGATPATTATTTATTATRTVAPAAIDLVAGARASVAALGARTQGTLVTPDGRSRTYRTYVPASRPAAGLPILVALHGGFGTGAQFELNSGFDGLAEANGFVVVYPDGVGTRADPSSIQTWNGGGCCGPAVAQNVDDVTFIGRLIDEVARTTGADAGRVVAAGHSNGAIMAHRLACELADQLVAVGGQAGGLEMPACRPTRPVSVLHIHGGADTNVPLGGGVGSGAAGVAFRPVAETMAMQAKAQGCPAASTPQTTSDPEVRVQTWAPCSGAAVVRFVLVTDATHAWMGSDRGAPALSGAPSMRIDASRVLVSFFLDALARR